MDAASLKGKVVILNIWATWCQPCLIELPSLQKLAQHFAGADDVAVVCVSREPLKTVQKEMKDPAMCKLLFSSEGSILPAVYETKAIPATFVIDHSGRIVLTHIGTSNWNSPELIAYIEKLRKD